MAIVISGGGAAAYGYYLGGFGGKVPFVINPDDINSTDNYYANNAILSMPVDLTPLANSITLTLSNNCFQVWSDYSFINSLTTFDASVQSPVGNNSQTTCTSLTGLVLPQYIVNVTLAASSTLNDYLKVTQQNLINISNINLSGCALDQQSANNQIYSLYDLVTNKPYVGTPGTLDLSGGTNQAPTAAYEKDSLILDYGWTILTN